MERKFGCLESPSDLRDYRICKSATRIDLPEEFRLSNKNIKDQGSVNSCVAHALSSTLENKFDKNFSTGWIYGYRPLDYYQGEGMYPREAIKTLYNLGAVENKDFNYNVEMQEAKTLVDKSLPLLEVEAEDNKLVTAYARLYTESEIKTWLFTKETPVPFSIATDNLKLDKNNIIQIPNKYPSSGHMMIIIGWNSTGFIIQNSWGEDWGDKGTAILPYEYEIKEAWGLTLANQPKDNTIVKPKFNFIRRVLQIIIEVIKALLNKGGNI